MGVLIVIHALICVLLIAVILVQSGRGGGLVEGFSGVESMFGPKTNTFLTRTTTVLSTLFLISCVLLAFMSARQSKSLIRDFDTHKPAQTAQPIQNATVKDVNIPKQETAGTTETKPATVEQSAPKQELPKTQ